MSADFLMKTAAVLEAAAAALDEQEANVRAAVKTARESTLRALNEQYSQLTGEDLPSDVATKLASSDESVLGAVKSVFTKTAGTVESLGRSSESRETTADRRPTTKKEAADAAWHRFGGFINS